MECERCGSTEFQEEDGFFFCLHCQTQSQGFAKEVNEDEQQFIQTREVKTGSKSKDKEKASGGKRKTREDFSQWSTVEAFNHIYLGMIEDFFKILEQNNLEISESLFLTTSMQIWFKFLRQCELAFLPNEHIDKRIKLHPASRHRDNFLLGSAALPSQKIPLYHHSQSYKSKPEPQLLRQGTRYTVGDEKRIECNFQYFKDDIASTKYKDPHFYKKLKNSNKYKRVPIFAMEKLKTPDFERNQEPFQQYIQTLITNPSEEMACEFPCHETNREETATSSEQLLDNTNYDEILLERMPVRLKKLRHLIPLSKLKKQMYPASPLMHDLITKPKLLALLCITIRLLNFNIHLSDLIRWCVQGHICYLKAFQSLPNSWECTWLDLEYFKSNRVPAYRNLTILMDQLIDYCCIPKDLFPAVDFGHLMRRCIKDLNLPKGLFLIANRQFDTFMNDIRMSNMRSETHSFDVVVIIAVIMSLRDLFHLTNSTVSSYTPVIQNASYENLFIWQNWLEYSKLRLSLIKAFIINIRCDLNNNFANIDELLASCEMDNKYYRENKDSLKDSFDKHRLYEYRCGLQDTFESLFLIDENNSSWQNEISQNYPIPPSLFPLTTYTDFIQSKITNPYVKSILNTNFRTTLITPYQSANGQHRPKRHISNEYRNLEEFGNDSFLHLVEIGSIITSVDLNRYTNLFAKADKLSHNI